MRAALLLSLLLLAGCGGPERRHPLLNPALGKLQRMPLPPTKLKVMDLVERRLAAGDADHISVMFQCLNTGYWFGISEHENFVPASLLKAYVMIMVLKEAESDPGLLRRKLEYKDYEAIFGRGLMPEQQVRPVSRLAIGQKYTYEQLLRQMISQSDNNAAYNLQLSFPQEKFERVLFDFGIRMPESGDTYISLKNYLMMLLSLYDASYLSIEMSQRALKLLTESAFTRGLAAGLPKGVPIANKFGEREYAKDGVTSIQLHDCAIVYHPKAPYLLGVITRGHDIARQTAVIRDISALVWNEVDAGIRNAP